VIFSLVEEPDQPVNLVAGLLAKPTDRLKDLLGGDIGGQIEKVAAGYRP
jgi:hypothetical protein